MNEFSSEHELVLFSCEREKKISYLLTYLITYSITYLITYLLTYSMEQSPP
jgi:hypothetical protein